MNHIPGIDVDRVSAAYEARVRAALRGQFPAELHLADRLDPMHWTLEWSLPKWLGDSYGLEPEVALEICLSNVLGLTSIRLGDDLEDGEVRTVLGRLPTADVSERLYKEALTVYKHLFAPESDFWAQLDLRMSEWRNATIEGGSHHELARRGAPLKISAFAVCLLTDREQEFETINLCLDHALAGMVLYDSVIDWREDQVAGRWNPFVDAALAQAADVEVAMLTTDVVPAHFREIVGELNRSATLAAGLGVAGLYSHLTHLALELDQEGVQLARRYTETGARAQSLLFGDQPPLAA